MLILTAQNVTGDGRLERSDGTSDYDVWVGINQHCIYRGSIHNHKRDAGAAELIRLIAEKMGKDKWVSDRDKKNASKPSPAVTLPELDTNSLSKLQALAKPSSSRTSRKK